MKYAFWITIGGLFIITDGMAVNGTFMQSPFFSPHTELTTTAVTTSITSEDSSPLSTQADTAVTLVGELVCLPNRAGAQKPLTPICAIGLRTSEGEHYALENINPYIIEGKVTTGQRVKMTGLLRSGIDTGYDTVGIIHVTSVNKLN
jgi:hypothetical protein